MGENGLSAADVALLQGRNSGMYGDGGWGSMIWIFALLVLANGFNGFGFGGGNSSSVQADVNRGFDNQNLQAQTRDILGAVTNGTAQNVAAVNQVYHDITGYIGDKYGELQRDVGALAVGQANMLANQNSCCCNILRAIDAVNYNGAMNTASINQTTNEMGQKIIDAIVGNRMADMQNQIYALQLDRALSGVVRYPNGWTYNAGTSPFCGNGCGCN